MKWEDLATEPCSVARSHAVLGDRWTLLILRDCFMGVRRFDGFQARLGISRTIIADRLDLLVSEGILSRTPYQERPVRYDYRLTPKGVALHPILLGLVQWGDTYYAGAAGPPVIRRHTTCGHDLHLTSVCTACGETVSPRDVTLAPGPGAAVSES